MKNKKIEKLDITKQTIERETKIRQELPMGFIGIEQQYNVIEDKINEIIDKLNKIS